jgi:hypothetical protein
VNFDAYDGVLLCSSFFELAWLQELPQVIRNQFAPMVGAEVVIWTPVQYINFRLLPVHQQQMFVNVVSVVEAAVLSWCEPDSLTTRRDERVHSHHCEYYPSLSYLVCSHLFGFFATRTRCKKELSLCMSG